MNTTTAAQQAGVTTDTIRTWARMGAIRATKRAGRWSIEAASLTRRITRGIHRNRKAPAMDTHTCGHEGRTTATATSLAKPCPSCRRANAENAVRDTLADLRADLPALTEGSPKQIEWAERIRERVFAGPDPKLNNMSLAQVGPLHLRGRSDGTVARAHEDRMIERDRGIPRDEQLTPEQARQVLATERTTTSAIWWIDNYKTH